MAGRSWQLSADAVNAENRIAPPKELGKVNDAIFVGQRILRVGLNTTEMARSPHNSGYKDGLSISMF